VAATCSARGGTPGGDRKHRPADRPGVGGRLMPERAGAAEHELGVGVWRLVATRQDITAEIKAELPESALGVVALLDHVDHVLGAPAGGPVKQPRRLPPRAGWPAVGGVHAASIAGGGA